MNKKTRKLQKIDQPTLSVVYVGKERYSILDKSARNITELTNRDVRSGDLLRFLIDKFLEKGSDSLLKSLKDE